MELLTLFVQTILLRPYVFTFLAISLFSSGRLLGWRRTWTLFGITWLTAFVSEFSSTRIGIPFGEYYYTGSTKNQELYISNVPFMDSLSFTFLMYASYCVALVFVLPQNRSGSITGWTFEKKERTSWSVVLLSTLFFTFIDIVIDPVALRGNRWFLGQIYGYPIEGVYFGVPVANFIGWAVVGIIAMSSYRLTERYGLVGSSPAKEVARNDLLVGIGLYYGVLVFNLIVTFWIGEYLIGMVGCLIYLPISFLLILRLWGRPT